MTLICDEKVEKLPVVTARYDVQRSKGDPWKVRFTKNSPCEFKYRPQVFNSIENLIFQTMDLNLLVLF